ncbi:unnamed protein product, partial [Thlaspi arvense]
CCLLSSIASGPHPIAAIFCIINLGRPLCNRAILSNTEMNREELGNIITVRAKPAGALFVKNNGHREDKEESRTEPDVGLEFDSAEDAQEFYSLYAAQTGFRIRIGQLYMSRVDGSVISRRFVCSKGGFQPNSRIGCPAFIKVQKNDSWKWILANIKKEHNHELGLPWEIRPPHIKRKAHPAPRLTNVASTRTGIRSLEEEDVCPLPSGIVDVKPFKRERQKEYLKLNLTKVLNSVLLMKHINFIIHMQLKLDSKFALVNCSVQSIMDQLPLEDLCAHRKDISTLQELVVRQESGKWIVDCLQKEHNHSLDSTMDSTRLIAAALNGFREEAASGLDNLDLAEANGRLKLAKEVSQTPSEFDPAWSIILQKYDLKENAWLKEMYRTRKSWVPLYIRGTFFAGIGMDGSFKSFFSSYLNAPTPLDEFVLPLEQHREEEKKEDINSFNLQVVLHAKDPKEEQGRLLCTMTMFKAFQKELLECYGYVGIKITMEGSISRYLKDASLLMRLCKWAKETFAGKANRVPLVATWKFSYHGERQWLGMTGVLGGSALLMGRE